MGHNCETCGAPNATFEKIKKEKRRRRIVSGRHVTAPITVSRQIHYFCDRECANASEVEVMYV